MSGFLGELRRRGVAKAAAVYAVAAWIVIEASSVIFPALHLPEWTVTFIVVLALLGFPVTLVFAWVFDFTREGIVRTPGREEAPEAWSPPGRGRIIDFIVIALLLGVIGWLGWERVFDREEGALAAALDSIAVLPFVNMSADPENEYFGDGLAEELLNALVRVEGLRVAARTSSFEYRGQNLDVRRIGEALNVATVLEGSVRRAGDRVRVTAQLIRADDGFHLWSETYDRNMQDIFAVQDEISLAIVDALRVTLGADERERVTAHSTENVAAFEAYMRGRFEMNRRTAASLRRAIAHFERAVGIDTDYARAYSGLSDTWILLNSYGGVPMEESTEHAESYARRALELDPDLAEAHASLGLVLRNEGDVAGSIVSLERAIELNPSYSPALHWLGLSYQDEGRFDDALRVLEHAVEIDPQYLTAKRALAGLLGNMGRAAESEAMWRRVLREHPADPFSHYGMAGHLMGRGQRVEAFRHIVRAVELAPDDPGMRATAMFHLMQLGDFERAAEQAAIVESLAPGHPLIENWRVSLAFATLEPADIADALEAVDEMPEGFTRNVQTCGLYYVADRFDDGLAACRRVLGHFNWSPEEGGPMPNEAIDAAATMMFTARTVGDDALAERLLGEIREQFARMAEGGLGGDELRWAEALIDAHANGDIEPLVEMLPERMRLGGWNLMSLERQPILAPVRDDPRFIALAAELQAELAELREQARAIPIPGPP